MVLRCWIKRKVVDEVDVSGDVGGLLRDPEKLAIAVSEALNNMDVSGKNTATVDLGELFGTLGSIEVKRDELVGNSEILSLECVDLATGKIVVKKNFVPVVGQKQAYL